MTLRHSRLIFVIGNGREKGEPTFRALSFSDGVERLIHRDAIKPGSQLRVSLEPLDIAMRLDEGLLHDVVGEGGIIQDALDAAPQPRVVITMQFTPGGFFACDQSRQ